MATTSSDSCSSDSNGSSSLGDGDKLEDIEEDESFILEAVNSMEGGGKPPVGERKITCDPDQTTCFLSPSAEITGKKKRKPQGNKRNKNQQGGGGANGLEPGDSDDDNSDDFLIPLSQSTYQTKGPKHSRKGATPRKRSITTKPSPAKKSRKLVAGKGVKGQKGGGYKKRGGGKCGSKSRTSNQAGGGRRKRKTSKKSKTRGSSKLSLIGGRRRKSRKQPKKRNQSRR